MVFLFGCRSSPKLFDQFATGLKYIMHCTGVKIVEKYLDDFYSCSSTQAECLEHVNLMMKACAFTGFKVNPQKVCTPTKRLGFLRIIIDRPTEYMRIEISQDRLKVILGEPSQWSGKKSCTKRHIVVAYCEIIVRRKSTLSGICTTEVLSQ